MFQDKGSGNQDQVLGLAEVLKLVTNLSVLNSGSHISLQAAQLKYLFLLPKIPLGDFVGCSMLLDLAQ